MVKKVVLSVITALTLGCFGAFAQGQRITGTVTDETGVPVIGGAVVVEGTTRGTTTDVAGHYEIMAPADATLVFSYLGLQTQNVAVAGRSTIDVVLIADSEQIEEVIVQAFGTAKKEAFTGSAKVIKSEDLLKTQSSSAASALVGKVAGLQTSQSSGSLGSAPSIRIRGFGSINAGQAPLWVVDGVPYEGDLNNLNMADIESMTVLKDAASNALYGARGANGVIMVTTKRAGAGDARVTFDAKWGVNTRARQTYEYVKDPGQYYEMHYTSLYNYFRDQGNDNATAYSKALNTLTSNNIGGLGYNVYEVPAGQSLIGTNGKLNPNATLGRKFNYEGQDYYLTPDDWMDELYDPSFRQEYNISIAGATEKSNMFASFGFLDNTGITEGSHMTRWTARLRADYQAKKWLKVGANMNYTHFNWDGASSMNEGDGSTGDVFSTVANMAPIYPVYVRDGEGNVMTDEHGWPLYDSGDGSVNGVMRTSGAQSNPLQNIWLDESNSEGNAFGVNGFADFIFMPGLKLTINGAVTVDETRSTSMQNPYYGQFVANGGVLSKQHTRQYAHNLQQLLNYNTTLGKDDMHSLDLLLGHETYTTKYYYVGASKSNIFSTDNNELAGAVVDMGTASSYRTEYINEGYFFRAQYNYGERIFASASFRRDASSNFHPDHRWGNFWSVGAAWIINREQWFNAPVFSMLKVKASIGSQGNDAIGSYRYTDIYSVGNDGAGGVSVSFAQKGNPNITWETNTNFNVGVEFGLWQDRLTGSIDFFNRKTSDMLFSVPVAPSMGYSSYYDNIGDMVNRGIEVELSADLIRSRNVTWTFGLNLTHVRNKVLRLPDDRKNFTVDGYTGFISGSQFIAEGLPMYTWLLPEYRGLSDNGEAQWYYKYQASDSEGNLLFNEDGTEVWEEGVSTTYSYASQQTSRKLKGGATPKLYGGFNTSLYAYGFDFSIAFDYQIGGLVYDSGYASYMSSPNGTSVGRNYHVDLLDAWTKGTNENSDIPRFQYDDLYSSATSDRFLTSASYINISNINIGYTFPAKWWNNKIQGLRVYVACDNVFYWSKRRGLDPRQSFNGGTTNVNYSPIRTISGGVTLTF
ncbi:MAG: TonB-dependent receptor [Alistipes sp.]|nr:TonB-dependent receptor [Alistipes sp.]